MTRTLQARPSLRERVLVVRADAHSARNLRSLEDRYPELEFIYCESFLSGIVEASRGSVRAVLASVDGGPRRLSEAVGALREAGGPSAKIILCCSPGQEPKARAAMTGGADDYLIEPLQVAEVDRAIGYGRVTASLSPGFATPPTASMEELATLGEVLGLIDAPPREMLQKAADLIRDALHARGASIVVEGAVATSGMPVATPVLSAALKQDERVIGQVNVSERDQGPGVGGRGELRITNCKLHDSQSDQGAKHPGIKTNPYTLSDAQKLEHYAGVLSQVLAAASRQRQLQRLAVTDEASGLPNRRYLREELARILERAAAERFPVSLLLFDVDDFKAYNDRYGHDAGDEILRVTGELFRKHCREQDIVARYGGDEFAVVFFDPHGPREPGSKPPAEALFVLDRFKDDLRTHRFAKLCAGGPGAGDRENESSDQGIKESRDQGLGIGAQVERSRPATAGLRRGEQAPSQEVETESAGAVLPTITISGGLATYPWDANTVDALLTAADQALLAAKRAGKNRIFVVPECH